MTATHLAGPAITFGYAYGSDSNPEAGPSAEYQGNAILDPRIPYQPGVTGVGAIAAMFNVPYFASADFIPPAYSPTCLVTTGQAGISGTAMTLVGASGNGIYVNVPVVPFGMTVNAANTVKVAMVGPGHTIGSTTSGSAAVASVGNTALLMPGTWICIPEAGGSGVPLVAQVTANTLSTLTLSVKAAATVAGAAIFLMDNTGTFVDNTYNAGALELFDCYTGMGRGWSVTSNNTLDTGWTMTAVGYDAYGNKQTETIAVAANSVAYGNKVFKSYISFTPTKSGSTTGTLSVGTSDLIGFAYRSDLFEYMQMFWSGAYITSPSSTTQLWIAGDQTSPATASTKDVRGAIQLSSIGPNASTSTTYTNGTLRLAIYQNIPPRNLIGATYGNTASLFGVTPA